MDLKKRRSDIELIFTVLSSDAVSRKRSSAEMSQERTGLKCNFTGQFSRFRARLLQITTDLSIEAEATMPPEVDAVTHVTGPFCLPSLRGLGGPEDEIGHTITAPSLPPVTT
mmetsp:Transcript_62412/g.115870  ORF Transcript_62412/g.115870 Transcript_62412/m.115870 type:complete len:112 (-) Transcript_62412:193-528(-)